VTKVRLATLLITEIPWPASAPAEKLTATRLTLTGDKPALGEQ
jgi:hypothetical protein